MPKAKRFEDLEIFKKARDLCKEVYKITKAVDFHKDTRFVQQIHEPSLLLRSRKAQSQA